MQANTANERFWQNLDGAVSRNEQKDIKATSTRLSFLLIGKPGQPAQHRLTVEKFEREGERGSEVSWGVSWGNRERRVGDFRLLNLQQC